MASFHIAMVFVAIEALAKEPVKLKTKMTTLKRAMMADDVFWKVVPAVKTKMASAIALKR